MDVVFGKGKQIPAQGKLVEFKRVHVFDIQVNALSEPEDGTVITSIIFFVVIIIIINKCETVNLLHKSQL